MHFPEDEVDKFTMKMAKGSEQDVEALYTLARLLEWTQGRAELSFPDAPPDPGSEEGRAYLAAQMQQLGDDGVAGRVWRAAGNLDTLLSNDNAIINPALDHLDVHPRFAAVPRVDGFEHGVLWRDGAGRLAQVDVAVLVDGEVWVVLQRVGTEGRPPSVAETPFLERGNVLLRGEGGWRREPPAT